MRKSKALLIGGVSGIACIALVLGLVLAVPRVTTSETAKTRDNVEDYLNEYSASMQDYAAENTAAATNPVYILSKEESASIADKVYTVLQRDWANGQTGLTEEQIANLQNNVYSAVYEELQDKASSDMINNVYDNIMAICLNDIYRYADNKDAVVKQALEAQLAKLSTGLVDVDTKLTIAQNDYATLTQAISDSQAKSATDYQALNSSYDALKTLVNTNSSTITSNKASIAALDKSNKDVADKLNTLVTDDLNAGSDKALSAAAGKTIVETVNNLYAKSDDGLKELVAKVEDQQKNLSVAIENSNTQNANNLSNLSDKVDAGNASLKQDIDDLINQLENADQDNISQTITSMEAKLYAYINSQTTNVNNSISYFRELLNNTTDPDAKALLQKIILEMSNLKMETNTSLVKLISAIDAYQKDPSDAKMNDILKYLSELEDVDPDTYNQFSKYITEIKNGNVENLNQFKLELTKTYQKNMANYQDVLNKCLELINNSGLQDTEFGNKLITQIKNLIAGDTSNVQNTLLTTITNLFNSTTQDQSALFNAINETISELSKASQGNSNAISNLDNKLSADIVRTYNSLSTDLKTTNMELTNTIYNNYMELYGMTQESNKDLSNNISNVEDTLRKMNTDTNQKLDASVADLSNSFTALNDATLEQMKNSDKASYDALTNALNALEEAKNADVSSLRSENSNYYSDLSTKLNSAKDALTKQSDSNYNELIAKLTSTSDELTAAQNSSANQLLTKLESVKKDLADADNANKTETYAKLQELNTALADADAEILATLRTENSDAIDSLQNSITLAMDSKYAELLQADLDNLNKAKQMNTELQGQVDSNKQAAEASDDALRNELSTFKAQYATDKAAQETQMQQVFQSVSNGKSQVASAITDRGISTAQDASWDVLTRNISNIGSTGTAAKNNVLTGKTFYYDGEYLTGTMNDQKTQNVTIKAGEKKTFPANVHFDNLTISGATLASQTVATAKAANILKGTSAWVNGVLVNGTMPNNGAISQTVGLGESYTIPAGYTSGGTVSCNLTMTALTPGTATAADIMKDKTAWVNGKKVVGTLNTSSYYDQGRKNAAEEFAKAPYHIEYVYHKHVDANGNEQSADYHSPVSGGCFTQPVYKSHVHKGSSSAKGGCYTSPVYHQHDSGCYRTVTSYKSHNEWGRTTDNYSGSAAHQICNGCGQGGYSWNNFNWGGQCPTPAGTTRVLNCNRGNTIESYAPSCGKTAGQRYESDGVEYYALSCGKTNDTIDNAYMASGAPDSYVDETNPWYQAGFSSGKKHIVNMTGKYRSFSGFSFSNRIYDNKGQDYNNTWTCEIPLDWNDGPLMNWSFREGSWSGSTSYSYEGSYLYQCSYAVSLDNGVSITSGSFRCTSSSNAAPPSMSMNTHQFNIFDYNTEGATKFIITVTVRSHVQGGTGKYSQAGNGATLDSIQAYYLQDKN